MLMCVCRILIKITYLLTYLRLAFFCTVCLCPAVYRAPVDELACVFHTAGRLKSARITRQMNGTRISGTSCVGQLKTTNMQSSCSLTPRHESAVPAYYFVSIPLPKSVDTDVVYVA